NEGSVAAVIPKCSIGTMSCRKNGPSVFDRNSKSTGAKICGQPQFITKGSGQHITRTHFPCLAATNRSDCSVFGTVPGLSASIIYPIITYNAMQGRNRTGVNTGMSRCGITGQIIDISFLTIKSLLHQSLKSTFLIAIKIAIQIIPAHLIHYNADY